MAAGIGGVGVLLGVLFSRRKDRHSRRTILPPKPRFSPIAVGSEEQRQTTDDTFGRMEHGYKIPLERHCNCEIRLLKSKGGSTRFAAVCPSSPIPRYVKKEFAEKMYGKKFCTDLLKPFSTLSGRWAADRRWGPHHRRSELARRGLTSKE